jgi:hypothetical protein
LKIKLIAVAGALVTLTGLIAPGTANAGIGSDPGSGPTLPAPTASGAVVLPGSGTVAIPSTTFTESDGTVVTASGTMSVTQTSGPTDLTGLAHPDGTFPTRCWSGKAQYTYSSAFGLFTNAWFRETATWCGNGSKIQGAPGNQVSYYISTHDSVLGETFSMPIAPSMVNMYNSWAYELFAQGRFTICYPLKSYCPDTYYPQTQINIYADGGWKGWAWSSGV